MQFFGERNLTITNDDHRPSFNDACAAAGAGDRNLALEFFKDDSDAAASLETIHTDHVEFHYDDGLPWTSLRRDYIVSHNGTPVLEWWEEHAGYYGGMGTGWWVEQTDASGPPEGLGELLDAIGLELPSVQVPRPIIVDDEDDE